MILSLNFKQFRHKKVNCSVLLVNNLKHIFWLTNLLHNTIKQYFTVVCKKNPVLSPFYFSWKRYPSIGCMYTYTVQLHGTICNLRPDLGNRFLYYKLLHGVINYAAKM